MDEIKIILNRANELIKRADHLFYITYPLVKDNKLIMAIAENINNGMIYAMDAVLTYDRIYKRIPIYPDDFNVKLNIFKGSVSRRYNIEREHIVLIQDLKKLLDERKSSVTEFIKNDKYVFFNQKQELKSLGIDKIKQNLNISKHFLEKVNGILSNVTT